MQRNSKKTLKYAQALASALRNAKTKTQAALMLRNFVALVKRSGDTRLIKAVLLEAQLIYEAKGKKRAEIVSASLVSKTLQNRMKHVLGTKGFGTLAMRQDAKLLGGSALFLGNEYLIDGTLREKLRRIFF